MGTILLMGAGLQTTVTGSTYDPDAQLFFNAQSGAGVTLTTTQKDAVNQWVVDAKAIGIWTKMKAIYPIVGGTATAHKFNLKNPLDTNAAYRLVFSGGWTHSSTGMLPNGTNAYANTFLIPTVNGTLNSSHISFYSRTDSDNGGTDISANNFNGLQGATILYTKSVNNLYGTIDKFAITVADYIQFPNTNSLGFYTLSKTASNLSKGYKNGSLLNTSTVTGNPTNRSLFLSATNKDNPVQVTQYSNRQCAFSTIGDGLTDLESQLFYQITEKYQVALGRNINALQSFYYNSAYNNETNAFLFSTQITDNTIQTATNTLVTDLKTAGVFTKMKAIYPMVGGTATTHKFNLVNAQDSTAAFALSFIGGWTHSANGALPNGTNAYANSFLIPSTALSSINNSSFSFYNRTSNAYSNSPTHGIIPVTITDRMYVSDTSPTGYQIWGTENVSFNVSYSNVNRQGFYTAVRTASNSRKTYRNGVVVGSNTGNDTGGALSSISFFIGAANGGYTASTYTNNQIAFASIGDGLTDAEALALYNAVQLFNTTLARQV